ncbi:hypothetical protein [Flavobacterium taihuense]|uniref:Uncharacterized protein n=1 Tax=Flavobacterium taihuense TaxID=2857508 RepID=A0ABS6Y1D4_9FLAO|nr:hypothetical protein [Flavobacterium taihuense]MBW4362744.1 hypothetical protein [Flavobacterium taihuense]
MKSQILEKDFWIKKRQIVRNSYGIDDNWLEIIEKFKTRIENYYLTPIDSVKEPMKLKGEGFTILTIQCALIEMFASFKYGKIHNHNKKGKRPNYEYKIANECFIPFLHSESIFENHFHKIEHGEKVINQPFSATEFYNNVRCGLMHEARTKGNWVINAKTKYQGDETIFISEDTVRNKISIDRTILHKQLKKYFSDYLNRISEDSLEGNLSRRFFARKLDHLYEIPPDTGNFEWWIDN